MNYPKSNCCNATIHIKDIGEEDDPIRELFCSKCGKSCDIHESGKCNAKESK